MGRTKIPLVISTFLEACISGGLGCSENRPQNRASEVQPERVENAPESRGQRHVFTGFSGISGQNGGIPGSKRVISAKPVKTGHFA